MKTAMYFFLVSWFFLSCKDISKTTQNDHVQSAENTQLDKNETENDNTKATYKSKVKSANNDDWYWENTMASENNQLAEWEGGTAELVMGYRLNSGDRVQRTLSVGTINSKGLINFSLPKAVAAESELKNINNILFYDLQDVSSLEYTNGDTGVFANSSLMVISDGKIIGRLTLGNSVRVTYNLTNQSSLYSGDQGYLLYWVYAKGACAMVGSEDWRGEVRRDGTNTIEVNTNVAYDLSFKPGWNLVKTEVIGSYPLDHERGLEVSWFKNHRHTVIAAIPDDARYFYRANPLY